MQPQLKVGTTASRKVLRSPLNVEDAIGSSAAYRCKDAEPGIDQIQVVPVWEDRVVVGSPREARISKRRIVSQELGIAVGRQIDARVSRAVQDVGEGQRDGGDGIIAVIADVRRAWYDTASYLSDRVVAHARGRRRRRSRSGRGCRR
jgi:hypothetical protein